MDTRKTHYSDVDISDWANLSPYEVMDNPVLLSGKPLREAAARALKYARAGTTNTYHDIGFRGFVVTPTRGDVPLQTIPQMRLNRETAERKRNRPEVEEMLAQRDKLQHRPLDLPAEGRYRYQITHDTVDFYLSVDGSADPVPWSFPLSHPPDILMKQGIEDRDMPLLITQQYQFDIPCNFWLPVLKLISAGQFTRMQEWQSELVTQTEPGCFYAFVSHRWLSPTHPDPERIHARFVGWQLFSHLCDAVRVAHLRGLNQPRKFNTMIGATIGLHGSELAESILVNVLRPTRDPELIEVAFAELSSIENLLADYGITAAGDEAALRNLNELLKAKPVLTQLMSRIFVWYDYSCMPQRPRTEAEETLFRQGLEKLNAIQLLSRTVVVLDDTEDYMTRGWCALEAIFADTQMYAIDLLIGAARSTAHEGLIEQYFAFVLADLPHIVWRAVLDTEVFRTQSDTDCMTRLNLRTTEAGDLPYVYQRLRALSAPLRIHTDNSELLTGTFPLPVTDDGTSVFWAESSARAPFQPPTSARQTFDWTAVYRLETGWNAEDDPAHIPSLLRFEDDPRSGIHVAVIGSCEGEAVLFANWVRKHRVDLQTLIGSPIASMSWFATDIAPVGHFVDGHLRGVGIDAEHWVVVTLSTRLRHCVMTGFLIHLLNRAGRKITVVTVDEPRNNVWTVPSDDNDNTMSQSLLTVKQPDGGFPTHPGGLLRAAVMRHLLSVEDEVR